MEVEKTYDNGARSHYRGIHRGIRKQASVNNSGTSRLDEVRAMLGIRKQVNAEMGQRRLSDLSGTKPHDYATILDCLDDRRVVSFVLTPNRFGLSVQEECDMHFQEILTKQQAQQLVNELQQLVDQMI